jgi:hypothetical protein
MSLDEQLHELRGHLDAMRQTLSRFAFLYEYHLRKNPDLKDVELVNVAVSDLRAAKQILEAIPR